MTDPLTRRHFLHAAGAGAASVWVPRSVHGYSAGEVARSMAAGQQRAGISKWDLDTPCLVAPASHCCRPLRSIPTHMHGLR